MCSLHLYGNTRKSQLNRIKRLKALRDTTEGFMHVTLMFHPPAFVEHLPWGQSYHSLPGNSG